MSHPTTRGKLLLALFRLQTTQTEFFALDEPGLDITATEEALDKLLVARSCGRCPGAKHITTRWESQ